jgi:Na+/H+-dicarboxylate symporter
MRPAAVLVALAVGALLGTLARLPGAHGLATVLVWLEPLGTVFIRLITLVIVPLVVSSLFVAVASLDSVGRLGRIGGIALGYFVLTTLAAATVGVTVALLLHAGGSATLLAPVPGGVTPGPPGTLADTVLAFVPDNLVTAASRLDLLPLLLAVCLFAAAATVLEADARRTLVDVFRAVDRLSGVVLGWIMRLAPPAVLVLMASAVVKSGAAVLGSLAWFGGVVVVALAAHVALVLVPCLTFVGRERLVPFLRQTTDALVLAFSTASSSAALPVSLAASERLGLPADASSLVLPAGATLNKNGAAVYKAVTAICVAHWVGLSVDAGLVIRVVAISTLAAFTGAGVPGSSLVTTLLVLRAIGLGEESSAAIALVAGIDRPLDMCRTAVNTFGNLVGTAVVARRAAQS